VTLDAPDAGSYTAPTLASNWHTEHNGTLTTYDVIPRDPSRPERYDDYAYPVPPADPIVTSGFDLERPDAQQRRGNPKNPVGHGGFDLARPIGTPIVSIPLEGQQSPTRVLYRGMLFGNTIVTLHERPDGYYVAIHGHMSVFAPEMVPGATVAAGAPLGAVGDSWTPGVPHLHYEVRWVRTGVDPWSLWGNELWENALAVPCDPRNVLPLAAQ
jgi:murein DD-endopeptidase MepM/ murein hydrolase activator NlpD